MSDQPSDEWEKQIATICILHYLLAAWWGGDEPDVTETVLAQVKAEHRQAIEEFDSAVAVHRARTEGTQ